MKTFQVEITETLQMTVEVEAKDAAAAEAMVRAEYKKGDYILEAEHLTGLDFTTREKAMERVKKPKSRGYDR
ncbi:hypothetical protein FACS1894191_2050 [Clostridia bacterium]|nr:hypothetical protein FACS1894191_2050 [Clostridia bacterium]